MTDLRKRLAEVLAAFDACPQNPHDRATLMAALDCGILSAKFCRDHDLARALEAAENHARELLAYQTTVENLEARLSAAEAERDALRAQLAANAEYTIAAIAARSE